MLLRGIIFRYYILALICKLCTCRYECRYEEMNADYSYHNLIDRWAVLKSHILQVDAVLKSHILQVDSLLAVEWIKAIDKYLYMICFCGNI